MVNKASNDRSEQITSSTTLELEEETPTMHQPIKSTDESTSMASTIGTSSNGRVVDRVGGQTNQTITTSQQLSFFFGNNRPNSPPLPPTTTTTNSSGAFSFNSGGDRPARPPPPTSKIFDIFKQ